MDAENVETVLGALGVGGRTQSRLLAANFDKSVWRVDTTEGRFALRVLRPGDHDAADRELAILTAARAAGVPVAALRARGTVDGRPVLLLSWSEGRTLAAQARVRPWAVRRLGIVLGQQQALVHGAQVPELLTQAPGAWIDRFGIADSAMRDRVAALPLTPPSLLHLDFHADNVVVRGGVVTGVLDWENAIGGDRRADVARTWSLLRLRPREPQRAERAMKVFRGMLADGWCRGYMAAAGPLEDMALFKAWAASALLRNMRLRYTGTGWMATSGVPALAIEVARVRAAAGLPAGEFT